MWPKLLVALAVVGALVMKWQWHQSGEVTQPPPQAQEMANARVDYYLKQFKIAKSNEAGKLLYTLKGAELSHAEGADVATVTRPFIALYQDQISPWIARADQGSMNLNNQQLELQGSIQFSGIDPSTMAPISLVTERLQVSPQQQTIQTYSDVIISSPHWQLRSRGLRSDLNSGTLSLLSNVDVRYEIAKTP